MVFYHEDSYDFPTPHHVLSYGFHRLAAPKVYRYNFPREGGHDFQTNLTPV